MQEKLHARLLVIFNVGLGNVFMNICTPQIAARDKITFPVDKFCDGRIGELKFSPKDLFVTTLHKNRLHTLYEAIILDIYAEELLLG